MSPPLFSGPRRFEDRPFHHWIFDDFLNPVLAERLAADFPPYDDPAWFSYDNAIENKRACSNWGAFPNETYRLFTELNFPLAIRAISEFTGIKSVLPDPGLHGAGWHIHGRGGKLNIHVDYSLHPKLGLQRKLNLILWLTPDWNPEWGGALELWSHDAGANQPRDREAVIENRFNRAVLFDTTQNSWHGVQGPLTCPDGVFRKSIAVYYLVEPSPGTDPRGRALFSPTREQAGDPAVLELIERRSRA